MISTLSTLPSTVRVLTLTIDCTLQRHAMAMHGFPLAPIVGELLQDMDTTTFAQRVASTIPSHPEVTVQLVTIQR